MNPCNECKHYVTVGHGYESALPKYWLRYKTFFDPVYGYFSRPTMFSSCRFQRSRFGECRGGKLFERRIEGGVSDEC